MNPERLTARAPWLESWAQRELRFAEALPLALLAVSSGLDVAVRGGFGPKARVDLGVAAATAVVMLVLVGVRRPSPEPSRLTALLFAGLMGLGATLVIRAPIFGFYTFTGYFWAFRALSGRAMLVGVAAVAVLSAIAQTGGAPALTFGAVAVFLVVLAINAGVAGLVTWFGWAGNRQRLRNQQAIEELTETNRRLEETLRENAALQAQLVTQAREAGVSEERGRMAREIHDTLAQGLAGIITQLQAAEQTGADSTARERHTLAAMELARESLSEARRSVQALRPEPLESARLPEALQDVAARWSALHGVPVTVTTTGAARVMRPEIDVALLRTAQEALTNVAKHARASRVGLTLSYMGDVITLDVRDDGVGFGAVPERQHADGPNGTVRSDGGFGLAAMRQRIQGVAGTLEIESEPEAGTAISASVPAVLAGTS